MRFRTIYALLLCASPAAAQVVDTVIRRPSTTGVVLSAPGTQVPDSALKKPIITPLEAYTFGGVLAGALAFMPYDVRITAWTRQPGLQNSKGLKGAMTAAANLGDPGSFIVDVALWGGGRLFKNRNVEGDGKQAFEAAVVSGVATQLLKMAVGRARPYVDPVNSADFKLGRGFPNHDRFESFPSGHSTAGFAFATVITTRVARRDPRLAKWLGPILYGAASLTGLARIYQNQHWAGDIVAGAAVGTISGLAVVRWNDRHP